MIPFCSKRNQVYPAVYDGRPVVEKHFSQTEDWERESEMYHRLSGRVSLPRIVVSRPGLLVTEHMPGLTLLDELERQEAEGFEPEPWERLTEWLTACHRASGRLPEDGNLRNFLWQPEGGITGLDFECFQQYGAVKEYMPRLIAYVLSYGPAHTPVKEQTADYLMERLGISGESIKQELYALAHGRRKNSCAMPLSGIILAGGSSRRMGRDKAGLTLLGKTLLEWQVDKLRALGIRDIMLSGENLPHIPGTRSIPDIYAGRGPLGGLHACLRAAQGDCMVISVDAPLVPPQALYQLARTHDGMATVLRHPGGIEPLMGVYSRAAADIMEPLIKNGGAPVRAFGEAAGWRLWDYLGPMELLKNCNTPREYEAITALVEQYTTLSLPIL